MDIPFFPAWPILEELDRLETVPMPFLSGIICPKAEGKDKESGGPWS